MYIQPLSTIIDSSPFIHHSFADDIHLHMYAPDKISKLLHSVQSCMSDVKAVVTANMLKLNDNKTNFMFVNSQKELGISMANLFKSLLIMLEFLSNVVKKTS